MTATIQTALAAVMGDVREVAKQDRNTAQGFNFRGIDAVVNAVGPALRKHGVIVTPHLDSWTYETVEVGQKRTQQGHARVVVTYRFVGPAGDSIEATVPGEAMDSGDKATAKAMSVAFRTALLQALALPTDERDPDADSYERSPAKTKTTPAKMREFLETMQKAESLESLQAHAEYVAHFDLGEMQGELRKAYIDRKHELEGTEAQS